MTCDVSSKVGRGVRGGAQEGGRLNDYFWPKENFLRKASSERLKPEEWAASGTRRVEQGGKLSRQVGRAAMHGYAGCALHMGLGLRG